MPKGVMNTLLGDYQVPTYKLGIDDVLYLYLGEEMVWSAGPEWEWSEWIMPSDVNRNINPAPDLFGKPMNSGLARKIVSDNLVSFTCTVWAWGNQMDYTVYSPVIKRTGKFSIIFDYEQYGSAMPLTTSIKLFGSDDGEKWTAFDSATISNKNTSYTRYVRNVNGGYKFYKIGFTMYNWNTDEKSNNGVYFNVKDLVITRN